MDFSTLDLLVCSTCGVQYEVSAGYARSVTTRVNMSLQLGKRSFFLQFLAWS